MLITGQMTSSPLFKEKPEPLSCSEQESKHLPSWERFQVLIVSLLSKKRKPMGQVQAQGRRQSRLQGDPYITQPLGLCWSLSILARAASWQATLLALCPALSSHGPVQSAGHVHPGLFPLPAVSLIPTVKIFSKLQEQHVLLFLVPFSFRSILGIYCMEKCMFNNKEKRTKKRRGCGISLHSQGQAVRPSVWQGCPGVEAGEAKSGLCWRPQDGLEDVRVMWYLPLSSLLQNQHIFWAAVCCCTLNFTGIVAQENAMSHRRD